MATITSNYPKVNSRLEIKSNKKSLLVRYLEYAASKDVPNEWPFCFGWSNNFSRLEGPDSIERNYCKAKKGSIRSVFSSGEGFSWLMTKVQNYWKGQELTLELLQQA